MAAMRSSTLKKESPRILLLVNSPNQRSTRFNQLEHAPRLNQAGTDWSRVASTHHLTPKRTDSEYIVCKADGPLGPYGP